jgi:hypothetical protein
MSFHIDDKGYAVCGTDKRVHVSPDQLIDAETMIRRIREARREDPISYCVHCGVVAGLLAYLSTNTRQHLDKAPDTYTCACGPEIEHAGHAGHQCDDAKMRHHPFVTGRSICADCGLDSRHAIHRYADRTETA